MEEMSLALNWDSGLYAVRQKLGNFVQNFQINFPTNGYGLPTKMVSPVLLAPHLIGCETTDDVQDEHLEEATLPVDFEEGMALIDGVPIWERWDGERVEYYKVFKEYREAAYVGGTRSTAAIAQIYNVAPKFLLTLSRMYHWQLRCKAYDLWKKQEYERNRVLEAQKLEGKHRRAAATMLEQGLTWLEKHPEQLNAKIALQMVQIAMKAERLSVGLHADKPEGQESGPSINIHQTAVTANGAATEQTQEMNSSAPNHTGTDDTSQLQSILHILQRSGAFERSQVVDAEYTVVEEDS